MQSLSLILDVAVTSRPLLYAAFGSVPANKSVVLASGNQTVRILNKKALKGFVGANDWDVGSGEDPAGRVILRFLALATDPTAPPVYARASDGVPINGFVQSRWGGVTFLNRNASTTCIGAEGNEFNGAASSCSLTDAESTFVAESFLSQMQRFFGLNASLPLQPQVDSLSHQWLGYHAQVREAVCSVSLACSAKLLFNSRFVYIFLTYIISVFLQ